LRGYEAIPSVKNIVLFLPTPIICIPGVFNALVLKREFVPAPYAAGFSAVKLSHFFGSNNLRLLRILLV
jgi:hypothetical protein